MSDAVVLALTAVSLAGLSLVALPPSGFEQAVVALIDAVPAWLGILWHLGTAALVGWILVSVYIAVVRRRLDVLVDVVVAATVAAGSSLLLARGLVGSWPDPSGAVVGGPGGAVPLPALAAVSAMSDAAGAHLAVPFRRFGRLVIAVGAGGLVLLGSTSPLGGVLSLLVGAASAALVHVVLGTSTGRPTLADVDGALGELGVELFELDAPTHGAGGLQVIDAVDDRGRPVRVEVHGRDARDGQFLSRAWRSLWFRGAAPLAQTRQQQVEHEGFVALLAASRGLAVPRVVVAGRTARGDALIALGDGSTPLAECPHDDVQQALGDLWAAVAELHSAGMVHGALGPDSFGLGDAGVVVRDVGAVTLSSDEGARMTDLAQLLALSSALVGIERATVAAGAALSADRIEAMLPYLQAAALSSPLRSRLKEEGIEVDAIRSAVGAVVDVEAPDLVQLRRVSPQSLLTAGLLVLVAWALISALGNVDLAELWDEISNASPGWVIAALLVAQLSFVSQAVGTRGASPVPVPLGPLTMLEAAIAFIALAVPSTAGRLALDIRFFQRQGLPATSAVSISAIDGFSGFLVQITVLVLTLGVGVGGVDLSFQRSSAGTTGDLALVLLVLAGVVLLLGLVAASLPRVRSRVAARVRPALGQVRATAASLRSPSKLVQLFGGNLANQLLFAAALGLCLRAFGGELDLATLLVVYVAAALFGGMMPVPGGIGVMEAALMAGLVAAGVGTTTASATALLFRLVTFYLPPIWGWLALRWLRRRSYL